MRAGAALDRFFRNPETGRLVVAQVPNAPLVVFLVATVVRVTVRPEGTAGSVTSAIGTAALAWWALDEVLRGESPFRRVLGAIVLASIVVGLAAG